MPFGAIGAFLLVLAAVFLLGRLWFSAVEALLERIQRLFRRREEPPAWHPLPPEADKADRREP